VSLSKDTIWSRTSFWQHQALGDDPSVSAPLQGDIDADVCIVGGGFTGLWTALRLKEQAPDLDVVLIEARRCGDGGSGANAGYALPLWANFPLLEAHYGAEEALRLCRASSDALGEIESLARTFDADIGLARQGVIWGATCAAQAGHWDDTVAALERFQIAHFQPLSGDDIRARTGSTAYCAGVLEASGATLHPGRLVRLLRRAALAAGVRLHETTPMLGFDRAAPARIQTPSGTITADRLVLALYAWSAQVPELSREIVVLCSDAMVSAPQAEAIRDQGWQSGPAVFDSRTFTEGTRTTPDGRVLFNKAGGRLAFGEAVDRALARPGRSPDALRNLLAGHMPKLAEHPVAHAWSGAVDRTRAGLPLFGRLPGCPNIVFGFGYSGRGVLTTVLGSHILAALVLDTDDAWSRGGLVRAARKAFPAEPLRFFGGWAVKKAIARKDHLDQSGRKADPLTGALYSLKPGRWNRTRDTAS
jgi:glycine/D-amino acid oxidase-like deaminating enzyme